MKKRIGKEGKLFFPIRQVEKLSLIVADSIQEQIVSGQLGEDTKLPTETELAEQFEVSRATIREALARLDDRGLIWSRHGIGSIVQSRKHWVRRREFKSR